MGTDGDLKRADEEVSLDALSDRLGREAAEVLFERVDGSLRDGEIIRGANIREARAAFSRARVSKHAQLVVPGRAGGRRTGLSNIGDSVVIIKLDDLEAVVRASQKPFSWTEAFSPSEGLPAATSSAAIVRGSRGRRQLRA